MGRLSGQANTLGRRVSRTVASDTSVICYVKWNPERTTNNAGTAVTAATIQILVDQLTFLINAAAEVGIGTYTGNSFGDNDIGFVDTNANSPLELVTAINGEAPGQPSRTGGSYVDRWRAGLGDFRPGWVLDATSGLATAAANAMLGRHVQGLSVFGDTTGLSTASTFSVGLGVDGALEGAGSQVPDGFDGEYESTTAGVLTRVRDPVLFKEDMPGLAEFQVSITAIEVDQVFASNAKIVRIWDKDNNELGTFPIGSAVTVAAITEATPFVGPLGSPLWVECVGTGALTDGPMTVTGFVRRA